MPSLVGWADRNLAMSGSFFVKIMMDNGRTHLCHAFASHRAVEQYLNAELPFMGRSVKGETTG